MISATYRVEGDTHSLAVSGHAGYSDKGTDIVCAGASALVQALIGWIENTPCEVECVSVDENVGEVIVSCTGGEDVAAVFFMTSVGLEQLSNTYPDHVSIDFIGIAD